MCLDCPIINNMVSVIKTDFRITSLVFRISVILTLVFEVFSYLSSLIELLQPTTLWLVMTLLIFTHHSAAFVKQFPRCVTKPTELVLFIRSVFAKLT